MLISEKIYRYSKDRFQLYTFLVGSVLELMEFSTDDCKKAVNLNLLVWQVWIFPATCSPLYIVHLFEYAVIIQHHFIWWIVIWKEREIQKSSVISNCSWHCHHEAGVAIPSSSLSLAPDLLTHSLLAPSDLQLKTNGQHHDDDQLGSISCCFAIWRVISYTHNRSY